MQPKQLKSVIITFTNINDGFVVNPLQGCNIYAKLQNQLLSSKVIIYKLVLVSFIKIIHGNWRVI